MIEKEYIDEMCNYIKQILRSQIYIVWCWGAEDYQHIEYCEMPALRFRVNGYIHKGYVVVAFNGGSDAFEVYCLDKSGTVVTSKDDVYFDELVKTIDEMVEKAGSTGKYNAQVKEWVEGQYN